MSAESAQLGHFVVITNGRLSGVEGILVEIRESRFLIQLLGAMDNVLILVESSYCESVVL